MNLTLLKAVFFDLGDTLVEAQTAAPGGLRFRWLPGARETLLELAGTGLRVGLISNTGSFKREALGAALPAYFQWSLFDSQLVLLSSEVGLEKPDLRIFRLALKQAQEHDEADEALSTDPAQCLFCGESLVETLAAQRVGNAARLASAFAPAESGHYVERAAAL